MAQCFDVIQQGFLHLISFHNDPDDHTLTELNQYLQNSLTQNGSTMALDFQKVKVIPLDVFKGIIVIQRKVKAQQGRLVSINLNEELCKQLRTNGLDSIFGIIKDIESLRSAGHENKLKTNAVDETFVRAFTDAAVNIFSVQVGVKLVPDSPCRLKDSPLPEISGDVVTGTLSMIGEKFKGSFCITIPHSSLYVVYEKMFKEKVTEMNDDVKDVLAEVTNMIYGQAKTVLNDKHGLGIMPAIPTILSGNSIKVFHSSNGPGFVLPFAFDAHRVIIEISSEK